MQTNCRPGDLAVVLGDCVNDGLIVTVVRPNDDVEWPHDWVGPTWWVCSSAALSWTVAETSEDHIAFEGPLPDAILRPIRGIKESNEEDCNANLAYAPTATVC